MPLSVDYIYETLRSRKTICRKEPATRMDAFKIHGGRRLSGTISVDGSKNASLPLLATALLTDEQVSFTSLPELSDISNMLTLLGELGCESQVDSDKAINVMINVSNICIQEFDELQEFYESCSDGY